METTGEPVSGFKQWEQATVGLQIWLCVNQDQFQILVPDNQEVSRRLGTSETNKPHIMGACNLSKKKTEPSVLLLSLGFEKPKIRFWATYNGRIYFTFFFFFSLGYALPVVG